MTSREMMLMKSREALAKLTKEKEERKSLPTQRSSSPASSGASKKKDRIQSQTHQKKDLTHRNHHHDHDHHQNHHRTKEHDEVEAPKKKVLSYNELLALDPNKIKAEKAAQKAKEEAREAAREQSAAARKDPASASSSGSTHHLGSREAHKAKSFKDQKSDKKPHSTVNSQKEKPRPKAPTRAISDEELESDDSFVDNEEDETTSQFQVREVLKSVFGYDRKRAQLRENEDDDLSDMEASIDQIRAEERKSAKIAKREEEEEDRREEMERQRKKQKKHH